MTAWLAANMGTIIIALILLIIVALAIRSLVHGNKSSCHSCGGSCHSCPKCEIKEARPDETE